MLFFVLRRTSPRGPRGLLLFFALGIFVSCGGIEVDYCKGCDSELCLQEKDGSSRCVACIKDEHCQSPNSPTKKCTQDNKCTCGTDVDCPSNTHCTGAKGCLECAVDEHCPSSKPNCIENTCQTCIPGDTKSCKVFEDGKVCGLAKQTCNNAGRWGSCEYVDKLFCNDDQSCENGRCVCREGLATCGKQCVHLKSDNQHCGACNNACVAGKLCANGECVDNCPVDTPTTCGQSCTNTRQDPFHCGACDNRCIPGQICQNGKCICPQGQRQCGQRCINPLIHPQHCGDCDRACKDGQVCSAGACLSTCPKDTPTPCYGGCVNTKRDALHCGQCGKTCTGLQRCEEGQCVCARGWTLCEGRCVSTKTSRRHCGVCGKTCKEGQVCQDGQCIANCPSSTPESCYGGCFSSNTSHQHCGACGNACLPGALCQNGQCGCMAPQTLCDGQCLNTQYHRLHCGSCNNRCTDTEYCSKGKCVPTCPANATTLCQGTCVHLQTNPVHCGACGKSCLSSQTCQKGVCVCPQGTTMCGNTCVNLQNNSEHCGRCDQPCPKELSCISATCTNAPCTQPELTRCSDQCVNLLTENKHCGACNNTCSASELCCAGTCQPKQEPCDGKDNNCDGQVDEGCNCKNGETRPCGQDVGVCQKGTQTCKDGRWTICKGAVNPSTEVCDTKDNDCDGQIDEGCQCVDKDTRKCGSDTGECTKGTQFCTNGKWGDCIGMTSPRAEVCDGKDNDCDGVTDNNISSKSCYPSSFGGCTAGTTGAYTCIGICRTGTTSCKSGQVYCYNYMPPGTELCDTKDNDCDGQIDEGCQCAKGQTQACGSAMGACKKGIQTCLASGKWDTVCVGALKPTVERCDGKDNDCDGKTDEDFALLGQACTVGTGGCQRTGIVVCKADASGSTCNVSPHSPQQEICNSIDDDCDGQVDENITRECYPARTQGCYDTGNKYYCEGICKTGTETCSNGQWSTCAGAIAPNTESCNGKDDDCDGQVDEQPPQGPCTVPGLQGVCADGLKLCKSGSIQCTQINQPGTEMCNQKDDDCDGLVDEYCIECVNGKTQACGVNRGLCRAGVQTCSNNKWGSCVGGVQSTTETCNKLDDDCDGQTDEGCSCAPGNTQSCGTNVGECSKGTQGCHSSGMWGTCTGERGPQKEKCDGDDNDCDGQIDEDFPTLGQPCTEGVGRCKDTGKIKCSLSGAVECDARPGFPLFETCNGKDDDCDGQTDEGNGLCFLGKQCVNGTCQ